MAYSNKDQYAAMRVRANNAEKRLKRVLRDLGNLHAELGDIERAVGCKSDFRAIAVNYIRTAVMKAIIEGERHGTPHGAGLGYYRGPTSEGGDRTGRIAEEIA